MPVEFERVQETLGTLGFRIGEERFGVVGLFNDAAILQHDHLVGDGSCELHLVRHDEHGLAGIGEFQHHVKHLAHHFRIKRGGDLVEQQHFRMQDQRTADGHALALASGQLMRPGILAVGESDAFQQSDGFLLDLRLVALLHERRSERDVAEHGFVGEQVVALEHHADTRAQLAAALAAAGRFGARLAGFDNLAVQRDGTALNRLKTCDGAQQRRLARSGRADDDEHLAMGHVEGDVVQHWLVGIGVPLDQMPDFKACLRFPAVLRGLRNLFNLLSHASTSFPTCGPRWTAASTR